MNPVLKNKIGSVFGKILIYLIILYTFFILGKAVWTNWQLKKQTEVIEKDIVEIQQKNKNLQNLILYYQSDSFKEVQARKELGLKKPDETAIAVPVKTYSDVQQEIESQAQQVAEPQKEVKISNPKLWWQYFTK